MKVEARAPRATVAVCTRNRSRALLEACAGALALEAPFEQELLIVDNASTDDTLECARSFAAEHPGRVRVAVEPVLGLSAARNLAIRLARGAWIAFLDDDAVPSPGWLEAYDSALAEAGVEAAGGPVEPDFAGRLPDWFDVRFLPYVSGWDRGPERHRLAYNEYPRGANMAFRREAFERCGPFDLRLGRRGRSLRSCEEIELCLRIERSGGAVVYEPGARVRHRVEAERITPEWMLARFRAQGFSEAILEWKHGGLAALRESRRRLREGARQWAGEAGASSLVARCHAEASRAYGRGALYSLLAVPRWYPPPGSGAPEQKS